MKQYLRLLIKFRCPYCLKEIKPVREYKGNTSPYICQNSNCRQEIHRDFVEKKSVSQTVVGLVGFSGHGKTVYITSLFNLLHELQNKWQGYHWQKLDDHTIRDFYIRIPLLMEGHLPDGNPANFPEPSLFYFQNIPYFGDWFISFYDTAGEVFEDSQKIPDQGQFVAHADVIFFIASITSIGDQWPQELERLLEIYINCVHSRMHVNLKQRQHLIFVLSKAELLMEDDRGRKLPSNLVKFLMDGSYNWYTESRYPKKNVIRELKSRSDSIQAWMEEMGCEGLVKKGKANFKSAEFTLVSSLGSEPAGKELLTKLDLADPKRVLDPFFLLLDKTRPGVLRRILKFF